TVTTQVGASPPSVTTKTRIGLTSLTVNLAAGGDIVASLTNGTGFLVVTSAGIAGQFSGTIGIAIQSVSFTADFSLAINNTNAAVNEQFTVGSQTINVNMPGGPYLKLAATNARLEIGGQVLAGDFSFERTSSTNQITKITAKNVSLAFGDGTTNFVTVTNGAGDITISGATGAKTISATFTATVNVTVPNLSVSGTFGF